MSGKLLLVVNDPAFFLAQHAHLGDTALADGFEVHVACPDAGHADAIRARGFEFHALDVCRGAIRPHRETATLFALVRLYRRLKPDLVHHITLKPILYGTLAARITGVPAVVNGNTGFGYAFIDDTAATRWLRRTMTALYRLWVQHPNRLDLFLNPDDLADFEAMGMAAPATSAVITGPGVELDDFQPLPEPEGVPVVVLAARMLWHKGVAEFVEAARLLKARGVEARMVLVGDTDPGNLAAVPTEQLQAWKDEGIIEWWGYRSDMPEVFAQAHVVALPSYREGLGKVLIEGAASGRPLVATDVPGCREITRDGVNGFLVPVRQAAPLADALERLITSPSLRQLFGRRGRRIVQAEFGTETIGQQTLGVYHRLLQPAPQPRVLPMPTPMPARPAMQTGFRVSGLTASRDA